MQNAVCRLLNPKQFVNHPVLSARIAEPDERMLSFMTNLKVSLG